MASSIMAPNSSLYYNTQSTSSFEQIKFNSFGPKTISPSTPTSLKTCLSTSAVLTLSPESRRQFAGDDHIRRLPLANMWREIQGSSNWKNLVSPLDPVLQNEIVRYGEFVNACYKAFDLEPKSRRYLNCKHGKKNILKEVGLESSGYEVTKYIYATPGVEIPTQSSSSRWIGYVAVSSDSEVRRLGRRDIVVAFRGTVTNAEWVANLMSSLTPARLDPHNPRPEVKVERGFLGLYSSNDDTNRFSNGSCREQLLSEIRRLINLYKDEEISITLAGHSMGSSLAILFGYDLAELGLNVDGSNRAIPITVYSFAGPRVGSLGFKERCEKLGVKVLRVVNVNDPITKFPGVFLNENFRINAGSYEFPRKCSCYAHVGVELALDFFKMKDPSCVHDLGHLIRLVSCPRRVQLEKEKGQGFDFFNKIAEGSACAMQMLDSWQWQEAAMSVCNLVQILGI